MSLDQDTFEPPTPAGKGDIREYLEAPVRRPWHVLVPWILVTLAAVTASHLLPKRYVSAIVILVEAERVPESFVQRTTTEDTRRLQTVQQEILSRTRLEKVVQELEPYGKHGEGQPLSPIVEEMRSAISVSVRGNDAFTIEYEHADPEMAMQVANRLTTLFIEESSHAAERRAEEASKFITAQLEESRKGLQTKEEKLRKFKEQHIGTLPEQLQANLSTLQRLQLEQQTLAAEAQAAATRVRAMEAAAAAGAPLPVAPGQETSEIDRLRAELAALRTRYTDEHPDVQALLGRIARLAQVESGPDRGVPGPAATEPAALRQARLDLRALQGRQEDLKRRLAVFEARVEETPRTEQELTTLTRDYNTLRENYLALLNKKMSARMAEQLERQWTGERFRILDPANRPEQPVFPKKGLFLIAGLLAGLAIGLASSVAAELLDRSIKTVVELEALLQQPVLGSVPHIGPGRLGPRPSPVVAPAMAPSRAVHVAPAMETLAPEGPPAALTMEDVTPVDVTPMAQTAPAWVASPRPEAAVAAPAPAAVVVEEPAPAEPEPPPTFDRPPRYEPAVRLPPSPGREPPPPPRPETGEPAVPLSARDLWHDLLSGGPAAPEIQVPPAAPPAGAPALEARLRVETEPAPVPYSPAPRSDEQPLPQGRETPRLLVDGGRMHGQALVLAVGSESTLGSAPSCDLKLDLGNVDAIHARVIHHRRGLHISDLGSARGTYVNGRRIHGDQPVRDGDAIFLGPPGSRQSAKLLVEVPVAPVSRPAPRMAAPGAPVVPPPPATPAGWPATLSHPPAARWKPEAPGSWGLPRRIVWAVAAVAVAGLAWTIGSALLKARAPALATANPPTAEPGQVVSLAGKGFHPTVEANIVRFGERVAIVTAVAPGEIKATVPALEGTQVVLVTVETDGRRSNPVPFRVTAPPRLLAANPEVVQPGDAVTLTGKNLNAQPPILYVGGAPAEVLQAGPDSLRFRVPADLKLADGTVLPVSVRVGEEDAPPLNLLVGRLPIVTEVVPTKGLAGERVTLKGHGFDPQPEGNLVTFGGRPTLVFSASPTELSVAAPSPGTTAGQFETDVTVQAGGAVSASRATFTLLRPPGIRFVPRFYPAPVSGHAGHDHAVVATELGPVLLLTARDGPASSAERAARVATMMNALIESAARPLALALREAPSPAVALAGGGEVLVTATSQDAGGYGEPWEGVVASPPSPRTVAAYWTALLKDHLALFVHGERPLHVLELSPRGQVLADLYAAALRQTGPRSGVPATLVTPLRPSVAEGMRALALALPGDDQPTVGAAVVGRWQGTMEESETGPRPIVVRLGLRGSRLKGTLSISSPRAGVELATQLGDVAYSRGSVSFDMAVGNKALRFEGIVQDESMSGPIYSRRGTKDPIGFLSLRYVQ